MMCAPVIMSAIAVFQIMIQGILNITSVAMQYVCNSYMSRSSGHTPNCVVRTEFMICIISDIMQSLTEKQDHCLCSNCKLSKGSGGDPPPSFIHLLSVNNCQDIQRELHLSCMPHFCKGNLSNTRSLQQTNICWFIGRKLF